VVPVPVPYANLTNPQTLNLYAMTRDNPETFTDLGGHEHKNKDQGTQTPQQPRPDKEQVQNQHYQIVVV